MVGGPIGWVAEEVNLICCCYSGVCSPFQLVVGAGGLRAVDAVVAAAMVALADDVGSVLAVVVAAGALVGTHALQRTGQIFEGYRRDVRHAIQR